MIRPSSLYRSDSRRQPNLEANANNISEGGKKIIVKSMSSVDNVHENIKNKRMKNLTVI